MFPVSILQEALHRDGVTDEDLSSLVCVLNNCRYHRLGRSLSYVPNQNALPDRHPD